MPSSTKPLVLSVDDDPDILRLLEHILAGEGFDVMTANSAASARVGIKQARPDIILLDVTMPDIGGYDFCALLQASPDTAYIPVIFLTSVGEDQGKAKALAVGAADYLLKPIKKALLIQKVRQHLETHKHWMSLGGEAPPLGRQAPTSSFAGFREFLLRQRNASPETRNTLANLKPSQLYAVVEELGLSSRQMAKLVADFLKIAYMPIINPDEIQIGVLPTAFCRAHSVVAISDQVKGLGFVVSNPFDMEAMDVLRAHWDAEQARTMITEPGNIDALLASGPSLSDGKVASIADDFRVLGEAAEMDKEVRKEEIERHPIVYLASRVLYAAAAERASDIHIEPKDHTTIVRFRIDGDMQDMFSLEKTTAVMLLARLKAIGGLDIADKRRPQDGSLEAVIDHKAFQLRLTTTSTPYGESMIIRLLNTGSKPKSLAELGMAEEQVRMMMDFGNRTEGLLLIVGPTGSGKSTTVYSLLSHMDCQRRSAISVEDPVEYRIPFVNQQQVNDKAGITFESLLKSSVRQDPDILFIGEIRDSYSARMAVDFASTGHLTIATLHTPNSTSAIFRLERLGLIRAQMAESIIGIVAQRLLKNLCSFCRRVEPVSEKEKKMLVPFTNDMPSQVAHPGACTQCNGTGYYGREGIYEILRFDPAISEMIRKDRHLSAIRSFMRGSGARLLSDHGMEKVRNFTFSPKDLYARVMSEEPGLEDSEPQAASGPAAGPKAETSVLRTILVVEDDADAQQMTARLLQGHGYSVTLASDGADALFLLGKAAFDLVISDVTVPVLDGFRLLEIMRQKEIATPLIFLTSRSEPHYEQKALDLGAADYIHKPFRKDEFLSRVKDALLLHSGAPALHPVTQ